MITRRLLIAAAMAATAMPSFASNYGTADEAVAMVKAAQALREAEGNEALFAAVMDESNTQFRDRDLYVMVIQYDGVMLAHGASPHLAGQNLISLTDADGNQLVVDLIAQAENNGSGWVDYKWLNPTSGAVDDKSTYVEDTGEGFLVGVGIYAQ